LCAIIFGGFVEFACNIFHLAGFCDGTIVAGGVEDAAVEMTDEIRRCFWFANRWLSGQVFDRRRREILDPDGGALDDSELVKQTIEMNAFGILRRAKVEIAIIVDVTRRVSGHPDGHAIDIEQEHAIDPHQSDVMPLTGLDGSGRRVPVAPGDVETDSAIAVEVELEVVGTAVSRIDKIEITIVVGIDSHPEIQREVIAAEFERIEVFVFDVAVFETCGLVENARVEIITAALDRQRFGNIRERVIEVHQKIRRLISRRLGQAGIGDRHLRGVEVGYPPGVGLGEPHILEQADEMNGFTVFRSPDIEFAVRIDIDRA